MPDHVIHTASVPFADAVTDEHASDRLAKKHTYPSCSPPEVHQHGTSQMTVTDLKEWFL